MKDIYKNIIIGVLFVLFVIALIIIYVLVKSDNKSIQEIEGTVIIAGEDYVIINTDKDDFLIQNIKGHYNIGDEVKFSYNQKDLDEKTSPKTIKVNDEELLKASDNKEDNNQNSNTNNENNEVITEENNSNSSSNMNSNSDNNTNNTTNNSNNTNTNNNTNNNNTSNNNTNNNSTNNQNNNTNNNGTTNNQNNNTNTENNDDADVAVLNYVNDYKAKVDAGSLGDTLKSGFVTVVDFLFYNGTIKGYYFKDLTNSAKLKILSLALYFDSKIDKYFPNYKENISNAANKVYTNVKSKIVEAYLNITVKVCSNNSDLCLSAKENFQELKTNFGLTWALLKDIAGDGLANLKNWYEIWRES